jgi:hypothetical protein
VTGFARAWLEIWNAVAWPWRRLPRALRIALWVPIGLELFYLVAANAFLNFNLLPLAFAGTNQIKATVAGGWTIIPERVHVRNVRVIFQDHNLEFSLDLARGFLIVHLSELLKHQFHGSHLRGEGTAFRMRNRIDPWRKNDPDVASFAPFPEFHSPAVYEAYVPEPPVSDAAYNYWTVYLDDVDVGTSEVWVQAFRHRGRGRARGQFALKPARRLWVGPASLDLEPGTLSVGPYRVANGLHGRLDCVVHPFDVRWPSGLAPLRFISARVRLDAPALDPQVYALFAGEPAPQVTSASGSLHVDVEMRRGVLASGARLDVVQNGVELRTTQGDLSSEHVELHAGTPGDEGSEATLLIERGTVKEPIAPGYPPHIERLSATVLSDNRDATKDFGFKAARVDEARFSLRDASWLNRWLEGRGFALAGGGATVQARGRYENGLIDADALLESDGIAARLGTNRVHYAGSVAVHVTQADPKQATGNLSADVTGRSLHADLGQGKLDLAGMQLHVLAKRDAKGNAVHGEAKLFAFSSSGTVLTVHAPELDLVVNSEQTADGTQLTHFIANAAMLSADGEGARLTTAAMARGTLAQPKNSDDKHVDVSAVLTKPEATLGSTSVKKAAAPRVEVSASLTSSGPRGVLSGTLSLLPAAWRVDAGNMRFIGKSALALQLSGLDLDRHSGQVGGRLTSTGVTLGDTKQNADCPWSRVQRLELNGHADLQGAEHAALSLNGFFGQTELNWGEFITRADIGLVAQFDQGLWGRNGDGKLNLSFRNASLQSGASGKKGWSAKVPTLDLEARLAAREGKMSATAALKVEGARGRIGQTRVNTDLDAELKLDNLDLVGRTAHASGAVHVRNAALPGVADPVSNWWADVSLDSLYGHAAENLELGGTFRADLRDATPGLAILSEQGSLPKWVASAFPLRDLSVTGSLARRCRLTDIHLVQLSGGPAVARGRLQSVPDGFQGALLMRLAGFQAVSAGLDFDASHTHIGLFDGDAWLARWSQSFDRQSDNAVKLVCPPDPNLCTEGSESETASAVK